MKLKKDAQLYNAFNHFIDMREIDDNSIIVDAGACWGDFIKCLRKHERGKNCRIIAVECQRDNVKALRERGYQNVTVCERALVGQGYGDKATFSQVIKQKGWGNLFGNTIRPGRRKVDYEVKTLRINDIFSVLGIGWIDFLKMDIEGAEWNILKTMTEETASKIGQMSMEVHGWCGFTISDVIGRMSDLGFRAFLPNEEDREVFGKRLSIEK